jgi:hypothetical protein
MKKLLILTLCLFATLVNAASEPALPVGINLVKLKAVQPSEKAGDELYMNITVYPSQGHSQNFQVPDHPMHWLTKHVNKIDNLTVWHGELKSGESTNIVLSLIEKDAPPFNPDDLIGTVNVFIKNDNGKLVTTWKLPNRTDAKPVEVTEAGKEQLFKLTGEDSIYEATFSFIEPTANAKLPEQREATPVNEPVN